MSFRPQNEISYDIGGRPTLRPVGPAVPMAALLSIISKLMLPAPFNKKTKASVSHWSPQTDAGPNLPRITWKLIRTTAPRDPKPRTIKVTDNVVLTQQDFQHLVQFDLFTQNQEEADTLLWWFIEQCQTYQQYVADAGAQHFLFQEAGTEYLVNTPADKYPARTARYTFTTSMLYKTVVPELTSVTFQSTASQLNTLERELVTKGEDTLTDPAISTLLAVTSQDEEDAYTPSYDSITGKIVWDGVSPQPAEGESYVVTYLKNHGNSSSTLFD